MDETETAVLRQPEGVLGMQVLLIKAVSVLLEVYRSVIRSTADAGVLPM